MGSSFIEYILSLELAADQLASSAPTVPSPCRHTSCNNDCWREYPKSRFPNWTPSQVSRSKIKEAIGEEGPCTIYRVNIDSTGHFSNGGKEEISQNESQLAFWRSLIATKVCLVQLQVGRNGHAMASALTSPSSLENNI